MNKPPTPPHLLAAGLLLANCGVALLVALLPWLPQEHLLAIALRVALMVLVAVMFSRGHQLAQHLLRQADVQEGAQVELQRAREEIARLREQLDRGPSAPVLLVLLAALAAGCDAPVQDRTIQACAAACQRSGMRLARSGACECLPWPAAGVEPAPAPLQLPRADGGSR